MQTPAINITTPTPPRPTGTQFRLLYRGALSLPDSHLLLDGLTFAARLDHSGSGNRLLESPLALALESMRGRPSLRWMGTTKLADTYLDETGGISMDIHPSATLTRIYFENTFCVDPSACSYSRARTPKGSTNSELELVVARITPAPSAPSLLRLPRPDDPTPRRPPIRFGLERTATSSSSANLFSGRNLKRTASAASLGSSVRVGLDAMPEASSSSTANADTFKIPAIPRAGKERTHPMAVDIKQEEEEEDVFGTGRVENKGKRKRGSDDRESDVENQMEKANKTIIKQSTIHALPIPKTHPEYKDIYGAVYRGVGFALRGEMKRSAVDLKAVERFVKIHVNMYVPSEVRASGSKGQNKS
ncbi:VPS9 domain-containing protein [Mycena venus]|uniref:VPS9 domain-containing protein n=1 Tax=Mycena venus TaxID=2733690 RepID=A0A8H6X580_9AGAR|nr:VPS9 domain-containing protein [Mycena venus]